MLADVKGSGMNAIRIPVQAYILSLFPQRSGGGAQQRRPAGQQVQALANGLAMPSFWTSHEINTAFTGANAVWANAAIEFAPVAITQRSLIVPADELGMWAAFVNNLTPSRGIAAAFVFDLPSNEGGWGGGRIAVVAGAKAIGAIQGYQGRILAHELGHVLLGPGHEPTSPSNLMFDRRHPRVVTADQLEQRQINLARTRARSL